MYTGPKLKHPSIQTWIENSVPEGQALAGRGKEKGRDCASAFMVFTAILIGALDLTKAFDHITPCRAKVTWYGFSGALSAVLNLHGAIRKDGCDDIKMSSLRFNV